MIRTARHHCLACTPAILPMISVTRRPLPRGRRRTITSRRPWTRTITSPSFRRASLSARMPRSTCAGARRALASAARGRPGISRGRRREPAHHRPLRERDRLDPAPADKPRSRLAAASVVATTRPHLGRPVLRTRLRDGAAPARGRAPEVTPAAAAPASSCKHQPGKVANVGRNPPLRAPRYLDCRVCQVVWCGLANRALGGSAGTQRRGGQPAAAERARSWRPRTRLRHEPRGCRQPEPLVHSARKNGSSL